jgi:hypothetical protein
MLSVSIAMVIHIASHARPIIVEKMAEEWVITKRSFLSTI